MKRYTTILWAAALLAGCAKETNNAPATGYGTLCFSAACSAVMTTETRAETRVEIPAETVPAVADLGLLVESIDPQHDFAQIWPTLGSYDSQSDYLWATRYKITLFSGEEPGADRAPEGIDRPYFEGSATKLVSVGLEATRVEITARLANTAVRILFSDRFQGYFANGARFTLKTEAGEEIEIGYEAGEKAVPRYCYVRPARFAIAGEATKQTPSATQPAQTVQFAEQVNAAPEAGRLYTYVYDITGVGNTGEIVVTFNDEPIRTEIIDEELNDAARPEEA